MGANLIEHVCGGDSGNDYHKTKVFKDEYVFYQFKKEMVETVPNYKKISSVGSGKSDNSSNGKHGGRKKGNGGKNADRIVKMDKYGFLLDDDRAGASAEHDQEGMTIQNAHRWEEILDKVPSDTSSKLSSPFTSNKMNSQSKVKYYTRRGLPDELRQKAWTVLTGVDLIMGEAENNGTYNDLVRRADEEYRKLHDHESADPVSVCSGADAPTPIRSNNEKDEVNDEAAEAAALEAAKKVKLGNTLETIERDIHRTFPKHYLFHTTPEQEEEEKEEEEKEDKSITRKSESDYTESESEVVSDDDEAESTMGGEESSFNASDDIKTYAESTGQDPKLVVEAKKRMFNESMAQMMSSGGGLDHLDELPGIPEQKRRSTTTESDGGRSEGSLDIYDQAERDEEIDRMLSTQSTNTKSEALGIGEGQGALRRVLRAYSLYDTEVGYCQGMNFIAAMFLTFLSEEEAFYLLVVVMNEEPYKLRELFGEDMAGTHEVLYIAEKLMAQFLPKLARHMEAENIHVSMFVTQWLLTLYTSTFPFDLVARVWDCFLVEGWKVVYRVMLSLLEEASKDILDMPFEEILFYFREFPSKVDGQHILAQSLKISLKRKHIQKHVNEWRRHAAGGEERSAKQRLLVFRRRNSGDSSLSGTLNSERSGLPKIAVPNFMKNRQDGIKEIVVENLSEQLLPILGSYKFAVLLHNVLTPEECSVLIDRAEEKGFRDASIFDRRNNRAHRNCTRHVVDDMSLAESWFERIVYALEDTPFERRLMSAPWVDTRNIGKVQHAMGINERLRLLRYKQGQFFHAHNDATFVRGKDEGERAGETSYVSLHVYLNEKFKGGYTTFRGRGRHIDIVPKTGSILLFQHDILHEGQKVIQGKKYVIRTDVMYSSSAIVGLPPNLVGNSPGTTLTQQL